MTTRAEQRRSERDRRYEKLTGGKKKELVSNPWLRRDKEDDILRTGENDRA